MFARQPLSGKKGAITLEVITLKRLPEFFGHSTNPIFNRKYSLDRYILLT